MSDAFVSISFVADELLTSTKMNQLAADLSYFHDGTGLGDGIILTRHLGSAANLQVPLANLAPNAVGLTKIGAASNSGQSSLTVSSLAACEWLEVLVRCHPSTTLQLGIRFNSDTGNNYTWVQSADLTTVTNSSSDNSFHPTGSTSVADHLYRINIHNQLATIKSIISYGGGGIVASAPNLRLATGVWNNTSAQINSITLFCSTGNLGAASLIVFGA